MTVNGGEVGELVAGQRRNGKRGYRRSGSVPFWLGSL
jgi:hypothetical protein